MKHNMLKFGAVALVLAMTAMVFVACGEDKKNDTVVTTTAEKVEQGTGPKVTGIEDLYGDMTPEEISQFYQDLEDLGMTTDDIFNMLYGD